MRAFLVSVVDLEFPGVVYTQATPQDIKSSLQLHVAHARARRGEMGERERYLERGGGMTMPDIVGAIEQLPNNLWPGFEKVKAVQARKFVAFLF